MEVVFVDLMTEDLSQEKVYFEMNLGDLLIFPGTMIQGSDPASREPQSIDELHLALTLHLGETIRWDPLTWLQLSEKNQLMVNAINPL